VGTKVFSAKLAQKFWCKKLHRSNRFQRIFPKNFFTNLQRVYQDSYQDSPEFPSKRP
jgi:hypothetical protein